MSTLAWIFPVIDRAGRHTTARVTVNTSHLIVITSPCGESFTVDVADQFDQLSAALRQARELAIQARERPQPRTSHRKRDRR